VADDPRLIQIDGEHPNADGVNVIVERMLPQAEELIARVRAKRGS
jgi:lysophospholipase L1-like esterase